MNLDLDTQGKQQKLLDRYGALEKRIPWSLKILTPRDRNIDRSCAITLPDMNGYGK